MDAAVGGGAHEAAVAHHPAVPQVREVDGQVVVRGMGTLQSPVGATVAGGKELPGITLDPGVFGTGEVEATRRDRVGRRRLL